MEPLSWESYKISVGPFLLFLAHRFLHVLATLFFYGPAQGRSVSAGSSLARLDPYDLYEALSNGFPESFPGLSVYRVDAVDLLAVGENLIRIYKAISAGVLERGVDSNVPHIDRAVNDAGGEGHEAPLRLNRDDLNLRDYKGLRGSIAVSD